jgi:hypothetical protein
MTKAKIIRKSTLSDEEPSLRRGSVTYAIFIFAATYCFSWIYSHYGLYVTFTLLLLIIGTIVRGTYIDYQNHIATRHAKGDVNCPSSGDIPKATDIPSNIKRRKEVASHLRKVATKVFHAHVEPPREIPVNPDGSEKENPAQKLKDMISRSKKWGKRIKEKKVHHHLDMDHVKISFFDHLRTMFMLLPNSTFYAVEGVAIHGFLCLMLMLGIKIFQRKVDYGYQTVEMMLETSISTFFSHIDSIEDELKPLNLPVDSKIGVFEIKEPILVYEKEAKVHQMLRVRIDLVNRKFIDATLDGESLTAKDTSTLVSFILVTSHHVKIHAYANWGIDPYSTNPTLRWLSTVTAAYNRYGYDAFPKVVNLLRRLGFLPEPTRNVVNVIEHGLQHGVRYHPDLIALNRYSDFVHFIYGIRGHFLNQFAEVRKENFPHINGEAYFVGTVIHSLDHTQYVRIWQDSTWAAYDDPAFKHMAAMHGIIASGFSGDLPFVMFDYRFKDLKIPFFQKVYRHACQIDPYFANFMDATIIK